MPYNGNVEYMYHLHIKPGDIGQYVLLPGDPFRTDRIAQKLTNPRLVAHNREHKTWTGYLNGQQVSVTSTGMGSPSTAIAVEELIRAGATTLIRIGTAGPVCDATQDRGVKAVIAQGAVRDEGTSHQYIPVEYPAIASLDVTNALISAAKHLGHHCLSGIVQTKDSFYGEVEPDTCPNAGLIRQRWDAWRAGNVLCSDMETSALYVISSIRGCRAGSILAMNNEIDVAIDVACAAVCQLIEMEQ